MAEIQTAAPITGSSRGNGGLVIGIYGIPGCGKTFLLNSLKQHFDDDQYLFFEGLELINSTTPGGLEAFQTFDELEKEHWRRLIIRNVANTYTANGRSVVIVGHYMFWEENEVLGKPVLTQDDLDTYTHILYLDVSGDTILRRRQHDTARNRSEAFAAHLKRWQDVEKSDLRRFCYNNGILFQIVSGGSQLFHQVLQLMSWFRTLTESRNVSVTRHRLLSILDTDNQQWGALLFVDGDKTLTATDTGEAFWKKVIEACPSVTESVKKIFDSRMQYTFSAFLQAMLLYEGIPEDQFNDICKAVANETAIYPEFVSLLQTVTNGNHAGAVIVTYGLRKIWEEVLKRHGLSDMIKVIGGGRIDNGYVVTDDTKADLVSYAKEFDAHVYAFGDSPLDLKMLKEANQAIVVVGDEKSRSKSMDNALLNAIECDGLQARQIVIPRTAKPRLSTDALPILQLTGSKFVREILRLQKHFPVVESR